ncbi:oncoprotein-induced transcript 3 protein-like [Haliotis rubra]|uniref:oncoprotein-induced transcript 3 protein-like n=1 Tax=Haliotis rubra TaxID=36100 RepID=UPI001EE5BEC7|nr:oncoprotein-induced transcript 3 protein-like [Haliotis rubra]
MENIFPTSMTVRILYISVLFLAKASDPCADHKYIYDNGGRSPKCPYQPEECDRYITENWYQVVNYHGALEMPTSHVDINSCGANYPGWLNGTLPSETDGIVDMTVCVSFYNEPCRKQVTIQVKNCGLFYVYYLVKMGGCSERYCFGTDAECPTTTEAPTTTESPPPSSTASTAHTTDKPTCTACECQFEKYRTSTICLVALWVATVTLGVLLFSYYCVTRQLVIVKRSPENAVYPSKESGI